MQTTVDELTTKAQVAKKTAREVANCPGHVKDSALLNIADHLTSRQEEVLRANEEDYESGKRNGLDDALMDRLLLTPDRLDAVAEDVRNLVTLPDPVGEMLDMRVMPNGLQVGRRRVPLGVDGAIYERRPNITGDISTVCLKSGNVVLLRGAQDSV